jgi:Holliday junction DNA helicase RuvA
MSPAEIAGAVTREDDAAFRTVSGIGPKTAKLIVVSLAGKLHVAPASGGPGASASPSISESVLVALVGLGWSERVAAQAVDDAIAAAAEGERDSVPLLLRSALSRLGPAASQGVR